MDTKTFNADVTGKPSRLPAGSTLLVNGIHVPHPHAEVNLPGAGDNRLGDSDAVTEFIKHDVNEDGSVSADLIQEPLHDEVKPKSLTVASDAKLVKEDVASRHITAQTADEKLAVDPANKVDEGKH